MIASNLNSFVFIRAIREQIWLAGILILSSFPNAFAESEFSTFWQRFKSAVIAGDKATVGDDKIPSVNALWGQSRKEQAGFLAPL